MIKTFISHSSKNDEFVDRLAKKLREDISQLEIFVDHWNPNVGKSPQEIIEEVKLSYFYIPVLSNDFIDSEFCCNERKTAINEGKIEFPVFLNIDKAKIPDDVIIEWEKYDVVDGKLADDFSNAKDWEKRYQELLESIFDKIIEERLLVKGEFYQDCEHIDLIMKRKKPTENEMKIMFNTYLKSKEFQQYFFYRLDNLVWLKFFNIYGYLKTVPEPVEDKNSLTYIIPHWPILTYLENIAASIFENRSLIDEYAPLLFKIIEDVTLQNVDNYRVWWYFIRVLKKTPISSVPIGIIRLIPKWINTKMGYDILSQEILTEYLPKCLNECKSSDDADKIQELFDYTTRVKWVEIPKERRISHLDKTEEPRTIFDAHWLLHSYINMKNADKVGLILTSKAVYFLADRLKEIFRRKYSNRWVSFEVDDRVYRVSILHEQQFEFSCAVSILKMQDWASIPSEKRFLKIAAAESEELASFQIKECRNGEQFKQKLEKGLHDHDLPENVRKQVNPELINNLYSDVYTDHSYIWFETFPAGPRYMSKEPEIIIAHLISRILLTVAHKDEESTFAILQKLVSEEYQYPFFQRLRYYIISECWNKYGMLFCKDIVEQKNHVFENPNYEAEIYELLEKNIDKFSEKEELLCLIQDGPKCYLPEDHQENYINMWKQKWLSAVKSDPFFKAAYEKLKNITQEEEVVHFREQRTRAGPGSSPKSKEQIEGMTNQQLADFLGEFKTKDFWDGPTIGGLGETIRTLAQENPAKFTTDLLPFMNTPYYYIYHILVGLNFAWSEKTSIAWRQLLSFLIKYTNRREFRENKFVIQDDGWEVNYNWIIWEIGNLIQNGTKTDDWAFDSEYLGLAEKLTMLLVKHPLITKDKRTDGDPISQTRNSYGILLVTLLYISLRKSRIQETKGIKMDNKWSDEIKGIFQDGIDNKNIEIYTILGEYSVNFYNLDQEWIEDFIEMMKQVKNESLWNSFVYGYLFRKTVYIELFALMHDHYIKILSADRTDRITDNLAHHIAVAYLDSLEELSEGSLITLAIETLEHLVVMEIIDFYWQRQNRFAHTQEELQIDELGKNRRVIAFWRKVYEKMHQRLDRLDNQDKMLLSETAKLMGYLSIIDEESNKWLLMLTPYVNRANNTSIYIDNLNRLKDKGDAKVSAKRVGNLFNLMLNTCVPIYRQKEIRSIVGYLQSSDDEEAKELARKIIDKYGRDQQSDFLRDLWTEQ
jgi:hypothetical protein